MRLTPLTAALICTAFGSAAAAAQSDEAAQGAPAASASALYCLKVEPETGSRIETVRCETRLEWSLLGVDLDREWSREGVRVIG